MSSRVYLAVEGTHDAAFIGRLLKDSLHFKKIDKEDELDKGWKPIIPTYPYQGSLRPSVPAPIFYRSKDNAVSFAIVNAEGVTNLTSKVKMHLDTLARNDIHPDAVGVVLDADKDELPAARFEQMAAALTALGLPLATAMGMVAGTPRVGIFVLPDNRAQGTLEDLLLECAAIVYPTLGCRAVRFVDGLDRTQPDFVGRDLDGLKKGAGRHKAVVAAIGAVLKPSRAIAVTLEDNRWIDPRTLELPRIKTFLRFLADLAGVPSPARADAASS